MWWKTLTFFCILYRLEHDSLLLAFLNSEDKNKKNTLGAWRVKDEAKAE